MKVKLKSKREKQILECFGGAYCTEENRHKILDSEVGLALAKNLARDMFLHELKDLLEDFDIASKLDPETAKTFNNPMSNYGLAHNLLNDVLKIEF